MIIKELTEDFYVKEILDLSLRDGDFYYYLLKKENWGTLEAIQEIAKRLHLPLKCFGFAGNKDKKAITEQYISIYKTPKEKVDTISIKHITLRYQGTGKQRISLGDNKGNYFKIAVRDLGAKKELSIHKVKNFFDSQRFGVTGKNYLIGKAIIQEDFAEACHILDLNFDERNPISALRKINKRMLRFYINSYQARLWNIIAKQINDEEELPLIGFLTEFTSKNVENKYKKLMDKEKITLKHFFTPKLPEISAEGAKRSLFVTVNNFSVKWSADDLHDGKRKAIITFQLPKGAYATQVVKTLF